MSIPDTLIDNYDSVLAGITPIQDIKKNYTWNTDTNNMYHWECSELKIVQGTDCPKFILEKQPPYRLVNSCRCESQWKETERNSISYVQDTEDFILDKNCYRFELNYGVTIGQERQVKVSKKNNKRIHDYQQSLLLLENPTFNIWNVPDLEFNIIADWRDCTLASVRILSCKCVLDNLGYSTTSDYLGVNVSSSIYTTDSSLYSFNSAPNVASNSSNSIDYRSLIFTPNNKAMDLEAITKTETTLSPDVIDDYRDFICKNVPIEQTTFGRLALTPNLHSMWSME